MTGPSLYHPIVPKQPIRILYVRHICKPAADSQVRPRCHSFLSGFYPSTLIPAKLQDIIKFLIAEVCLTGIPIHKIPYGMLYQLLCRIHPNTPKPIGILVVCTEYLQHFIHSPTGLRSQFPAVSGNKPKHKSGCYFVKGITGLCIFQNVGQIFLPLLRRKIGIQIRQYTCISQLVRHHAPHPDDVRSL